MFIRFSVFRPTNTDIQQIRWIKKDQKVCFLHTFWSPIFLLPNRTALVLWVIVLNQVVPPKPKLKTSPFAARLFCKFTRFSMLVGRTLAGSYFFASNDVISSCSMVSELSVTTAATSAIRKTINKITHFFMFIIG